MATERKSAGARAERDPRLKQGKSASVKPEGVLAKISGPRPGQHVYPRQRLFARLDNARHSHSIIWIQAPAGAGKTTLIASYLAARKASALWYQMDLGDADIATFFYYMRLAAARIAPRKSLPLLTPEYLAGLQVFTRNYFRQLFGMLKRPGIVVLDNYHDVPADSSIREVLEYGLKEIPADVTVIILSRSAPPPAFARFRVDERMAELGWADLQLEQEESVGIAALRGRSRLSPDDVLALHAYTRGWAAGLTLMLEHSPFLPQAPEAGCDDGQTVLFDYFAAEVFRRTESSVQEFLLQTAFLPKISVAAAQQLTGEIHAERILNNLVRRNYFTVRLAGSGGGYEYHPLFRAFLTNYATEQYGAREIQRHKQKCAQLLVETGDVETAVALLQQVQDWPGAAGVIQSRARTLVAQGRIETLVNWIQALPQTLRDGEPWILYWRGICRLPFNPVEARECFEKALALFDAGDDASPLYLAWSGIIESFIFEWNDFTPIPAWLDIYRTLRSTRPPPDAAVDAASVFSYVNGLSQCQPDYPDLPREALRAETILLRETDPDRKASLGVPLLFHYHRKGDADTVARLMQACGPHAGSSSLQPATRIRWAPLKAMHAYITGSPVACVQAADEGLALSRQFGAHMFDLRLMACKAAGHLGLGQVAAAREVADRMAPFATGSRKLSDCSYNELSCSVLLHEGKIARAVQAGRLAVELAMHTGSPHEQAIALIFCAYALMKNGESERAFSQIQEALAIGRRIGSRMISYLGTFTHASMCNLQGRKKDALVVLDAALAVGDEAGMLTPPPVLPHEDIAALLGMALDAGMPEKRIHPIIAGIHLLPLRDQLPEKWPWPIRIYTLGRFVVLRHGSALHFDAKVQRRPLEMLKALIALGGRSVSEEEVTEALWPDAEGDAGHQVFATTLHRLRKLLDVEDVVIHQEGRRLTLDVRHVWVDAWAFERISSMGTGEHQSLENARSLYRGSFLTGEMQPWALMPRERLRSKFLRMVVQQGNALERMAQWREAAACYQQGLDTDALAEELYRGLIRCYSRLGQLVEARAAYDRCRAILTQTLGVEPSRETRELWRQAQSG